jgi:hypothetical protein
MSKENILVVKTGRSGMKVNELYRTEIECEGRTIRLAGKTRLVGTWYRSIVAAVKQQGITGTLSVIVHNEDDVDELVNEYQKLLIKLAKDVDWVPVAKLKMSMDELGKITEEINDRAHDKLAEMKVIEWTGKNRFKFLPKPANRIERNAANLYVNQFCAGEVAKDLAAKLEII